MKISLDEDYEMEEEEITKINYNNGVDNIEFNVIGNRCIDIIDGYKIVNDITKMMFINRVCTMMPDIMSARSAYSYFIEWKAHNILYKKGLFKKHTKDTGLDAHESWFRRLCYRIICLIFNE